MLPAYLTYLPTYSAVFDCCVPFKAGLPSFSFSQIFSVSFSPKGEEQLHPRILRLRRKVARFGMDGEIRRSAASLCQGGLHLSLAEAGEGDRKLGRMGVGNQLFGVFV